MKKIKGLIAIVLVGVLFGDMTAASVRAMEQNPGSPAPSGAGTANILHVPLILVQKRPTNPVFGIEMGNELADPSNGGPADLMAKAGANWVRNNALLWSAVEPTQGVRQWDSALDSRLVNAANFNLTPILIIRSTPTWAQLHPNNFCGPIKPGMLDAFANFMKDVVTRYSASPYKVNYYEIWNEPDVLWSLFSGDSQFGCWGDSTDSYYGGGYYAAMLTKVYPAIKQANPNAQVLVGGLLLDCDPNNPPAGKDCVASKFLEGILLNGGGDYFDGVSFHAYDYFTAPSDFNDPYNNLGNYSNSNWASVWNTTGPAMIAKTNYLRSLLNKYGFSLKYLMNTEVGLRCYRLADKYCNSAYSTSANYQNTKAYFLVQSYVIAASLGLNANVWYNYYGWDYSGLYNAGTGKVEPSYNAYKFTRGAIYSTTPAGAISPAPGVMGYAFAGKNYHLWVLWYIGGTASDGTVNTLLSLPSVPTAIWQWVNFGINLSNEGFYQSSPPSQQVSIGRAPVFIEFIP